MAAITFPKQSGDLSMSETLDRILRDIGDIKADLASSRSEQASTNQRLDDLISNHVKGLGKRLSDLEEHQAQMRERIAYDTGERYGRRVVIAAVATALTSLGMLVGNIISKVL